MNKPSRRDFIKLISGLAAGVVAAFMLKVKANSGYYSITELPQCKCPKCGWATRHIGVYGQWHTTGFYWNRGRVSCLQCGNPYSGQWNTKEPVTCNLCEPKDSPTSSPSASAQTSSDKPATSVCYCHFDKKRGTVCCNSPMCPDYAPGNSKPYEDKYE